jgi:hypothetical protein
MSPVWLAEERVAPDEATYTLYDDMDAALLHASVYGGRVLAAELAAGELTVTGVTVP